MRGEGLPLPGSVIDTLVFCLRLCAQSLSEGCPQGWIQASPLGFHIKAPGQWLGCSSLDSEARAGLSPRSQSPPPTKLGPRPPSQGYSLLGPGSQTSMGIGPCAPGHPGKEIHFSQPVFPWQVGEGMGSAPGHAFGTSQTEAQASLSLLQLQPLP